MKIAVEFHHTKSEWRGRVVRAIDGRPIFGEVCFRVPRSKTPVPPVSGPHGVQSARRDFERKLTLILPHPEKGIHSKSGFEKWFIFCVQEFLLLEASRYGVVIIPTTHAEEIFTADFIIRLAKRLSKKTDRAKWARLRNLEMLLLESWEPMQLHKLDRHELHALVSKTEFGKGMTAGNVWQTAYRLGLFSDERHGPKPRS